MPAPSNGSAQRRHLYPQALAHTAAGSGAQPGRDRLSALIGLAVWSTAALRIAPKMTAWDNLQTLAGALATLAVVILWPALHESSYMKWRTLALSALRIFLIAMPVNFNRATFDALTPAPATGRLAWMVNLSQLLMGTHVGLLFFCALLFQLPTRAHMRVQSICVVLLMVFGVHTHCQSQLFTSSSTVSAVATLHCIMGLASALASFTAFPLIADQYCQAVAALLFCWMLLGWMLPSLVLMLLQPQHRLTHEQHVSSDAGKLCRLLSLVEGTAERVMRKLLPSHWQGLNHQQGDSQDSLRDESSQAVTAAPDAPMPINLRPDLCIFYWLSVLVGLWYVCCGACLAYCRSTVNALEHNAVEA